MCSTFDWKEIDSMFTESSNSFETTILVWSIIMRNLYIKDVESFAYITSTQVGKLPVSHDLLLIIIIIWLDRNP